MNISNGFTISSENPKNISKVDMKKIHEIEQDMWAEGIGEYVKCLGCGEIHSKKDVFGHLSNELYKETVGKLEQILSIDVIKCKKCDSDTIHIWGENYLDEIKIRFSDEESFLTTCRNDSGEVIGFADAYVNNIETIYKREFEHYYSNLGLDLISEKIINTIDGEMPNKFLMHSTIGIEAKYSNLNLFLIILRDFYLYLINNGYRDIFGIYEACIGSVAHSIFHTLEAKRIGMTSDDNYISKIGNISDNSKSDIFIHPNIITSIVNKLSVPLKKFVRLNSSKMKDVLVR